MARAVWDWFGEATMFPKFGQRVKNCHFFGVQRKTKELLGRWTAAAFTTELMCLELDFYPKSFVDKIGLSQATLEEAAAVDTTSIAVMQVDSKLLRHLS